VADLIFAIKPGASMTTRGREDTLASVVSPIGPSSWNPPRYADNHGVGLRRGLGQHQPALNPGRIGLRSAQRDRGVTHRARRVACVPGCSRRTLDNRSGAALPIRSPPHHAWTSPCRRPRATQHVTLLRGPGFEKAYAQHARSPEGRRLAALRRSYSGACSPSC
jgi:hypothetical protein